ncbi:conserved hypothetical protein, partial [Wolbachia endosymbiont of Drosophila ananassae]
ELEEIIDCIHEAKQFDEDFDSALICYRTCRMS